MRAGVNAYIWCICACVRHSSWFQRAKFTSPRQGRINPSCLSTPVATLPSDNSGKNFDTRDEVTQACLIIPTVRPISRPVRCVQLFERHARGDRGLLHRFSFAIAARQPSSIVCERGPPSSRPESHRHSSNQLYAG